MLHCPPMIQWTIATCISISFCHSLITCSHGWSKLRAKISIVLGLTTLCQLPVPSVSYLSPVCQLPVHSVSVSCSHCVSFLSPVCQLPVPNLSVTCPHSVSFLSPVVVFHWIFLLDTAQIMKVPQNKIKETFTIT